MSVSIDHGVLREGGGEFVVRVEDQDAQLRIGLDRLVHRAARRRSTCRRRSSRRWRNASTASTGYGWRHRCFRPGVSLPMTAVARARRRRRCSPGRRSGCGGRGRQDRDSARCRWRTARGHPSSTRTSPSSSVSRSGNSCVFAFTPAAAAGVHRVDEGDHTVPTDADRNQAADRPQFCQLGAAAPLGDGGDGVRASHCMQRRDQGSRFARGHGHRGGLASPALA